MLRMSQIMLSQTKPLFANTFSSFLAHCFAPLCIQAEGRQPLLCGLSGLCCFSLRDVNQYMCSEPFQLRVWFSLQHSFCDMELENAFSLHIYCTCSSVE